MLAHSYNPDLKTSGWKLDWATYWDSIFIKKKKTTLLTLKLYHFHDQQRNHTNTLDFAKHHRCEIPNSFLLLLLFYTGSYATQTGLEFIMQSKMTLDFWSSHLYLLTAEVAGTSQYAICT